MWEYTWLEIGKKDLVKALRRYFIILHFPTLTRWNRKSVLSPRPAPAPGPAPYRLKSHITVGHNKTVKRNIDSLHKQQKELPKKNCGKAASQIKSLYKGFD